MSEEPYTQCLICGLIRDPVYGTWAHKSFYEHQPQYSHGICDSPICKLSFIINFSTNDELADKLLEQEEKDESSI